MATGIREAGIGAVALVAGAIVGAIGVGSEVPLCQEVRAVHPEAALPVADIERVAITEDPERGVVVIVPVQVGGEDVEARISTPQDVANALDACDKYENRTRRLAPRRAEWQAAEAALIEADVPLPPPVAADP